MVRVTAALTIVLFAWGGAAAEITPTETLQHVFARADGILTDPGSADRPLDRLVAVRKLVNEAFDFKSAAELASGDHWQARTAAEQEEFTWLFSDLLERGFVSRMASKARLSGGTRVRYLDESIDDGGALVQTAMTARAGHDLRLGYHLVERDGVWKIRDVSIDGVSLMANYRSQLDRVLGSASFAQLLSQMRVKVGVVDAADPTGPLPAEALPVMWAAAETTIVDMPPPPPELRLATFTPVFPVPAVVAPAPAAAVQPAALPAGQPAAPRAVERPSPPTAVAATQVVSISPTVPAVAPRPVVAPAPSPAPALAIAAILAPTPAPVTTQPMVASIASTPVVKVPARSHTRAYWLRMTTMQGKRQVNVRVGPFRDAEQAIRKLLDLQSKGHNPYLVAERD
jgi:phospholipid transport system substrate-binding protein